MFNAEHHPRQRGPRGRAMMALVIGVLLLVILFPWAWTQGQENPSPSVDHVKALAQAAERARRDDYAGALTGALAAAGTSDPASQGRALLLAGYCEFKLKRYDSARPHLRDASKIYPSLAYHGLFYGASTFMEEGNYAEAEPLLQKLIASEPPGDLRARAEMELMRLHRRGNDAKGTAAALARVRELTWHDPDWDDELDYTRGWIKAKQGAPAEARAILLRLWKDEPHNFWAEQAEKVLTGKATDVPVSDLGISTADRMERIKNLQNQGRPGQALSEFSPIVAAAEKDPRTQKSRLIELYQLRADLAMDKREFKDALADLKKAQALLPSEDEGLSYKTARCYQRSGRTDEAIELYRHLYTKSPNGEYATRSLYYSARLLKLDNNWDGAEANYKRLVSGYPNSQLRGEAAFQLAWIRILNGDFAKALVYLEQAPASEDDEEYDARRTYWKSVLLRKRGDVTAAQELEGRILRRYWDSCYAYYLVMVDGRSWPHQGGGRPAPTAPAELPREFKLARELYLIGLADDAQGQLDYLQGRGQMTDALIWPAALMYRDLEDYYLSQRVAGKLLAERLKSPPPAEAEAWRLAYPRAYPDLVGQWTREYELDPHLMWSLMRAESTYRPTIRSSAGAIGLMQIMPDTGRAIASALGDKGYSPSQLNNPATNVKYGCFYLHNRLKQFDPGQADPMSRLQTTVRALASYNAGPERVKRWGERADGLGLTPPAFVEEIPITETRDYVKKILGYYLVYHFAYASPAPPVEAAGEACPRAKN
jgi:soluble lytic murein transglycosylase